MNKELYFRYNKVQQRSIAAKSGTPFALVLVVAVAVLVGDICVFLYINLAWNWVILVGMTALLFALLFAVVLASFPFQGRFFRVGRSFAIPAALSFSAVALPSFGNSYVSATALCVLLLGALLLGQEKKIDLKLDIVPRKFLVLALLLLPAILAMNEFAFVGNGIITRFMEEPPLWFLPVAVLFGYLEEILFRGGTQSALEALRGWKSALIVAALLDAGLMALWGSMYVIAITFVVGLIMGLIFHRYHSASLCGIIRAIDGFWFFLLIMIFGGFGVL